MQMEVWVCVNGFSLDRKARDTLNSLDEGSWNGFSEEGPWPSLRAAAGALLRAPHCAGQAGECGVPNEMENLVHFFGAFCLDVMTLTFCQLMGFP